MKIEIEPVIGAPTSAAATIRIKPETETEEYALRNLITNERFLVLIENLKNPVVAHYEATVFGR